MRIRTAVMAAASAAALTVGLAGSAEANAWATYRAWTTNEAGGAILDYRYESDGLGTYIAYVDRGAVESIKRDGYGAVLRAHDGSTVIDEFKSPDHGSEYPGSVAYPRVRSVWFDVCNYNLSTDATYSCARLRKL